MNRLAFIRRMALAAAACAFIDMPWPKERALTATEATERLADLNRLVHDVFWREVVPAMRREDERWRAQLRDMYEKLA